MKIIHCADIHLDSPMTSNLDDQKAEERKNELLGTFSAMIDYAEQEGVNAVIIAGDLFDRNRVSLSARNIVYGIIADHPDILFFYLRGNHDTEGSLEGTSGIPDNLRFFGREWTSYTLQADAVDVRDITITGMEPRRISTGQDGAETLPDYEGLMLDPYNINIVVLHGQLSEYGQKGSQDSIELRALRNRNIDYLALGHVHEYSAGVLPPRGMYCYPGCLEGRGFDETGEHGFVLLNIDALTGEIVDTFIPFARRSLYELNVDITGCMTTVDISGRIWETLREAPCTQEDLVRFILVGEVDVECEKNTGYLEQQFREMFYFVRLVDRSRLAVDYHAYELDVSLKGELIRLVKDAEELSEEEKAEIIRCGLQALNEEEIVL